MFTALQLALATTSRYAGVNILATAAFGMLLWRPAYLHHAGFRLSFLSVAAILLWGVPSAGGSVRRGGPRTHCWERSS